MAKKISSKKTTKIYATTGIHTLLHNNKAKLIGYKVGFDSDQQTVRYTGGGCVAHGIVVFHYGTKQEDKFYFEDYQMTYQAVSIRTVGYNYLTKIYNECALEKTAPNDFIEKIQTVYTMKTMGF